MSSNFHFFVAGRPRPQPRPRVTRYGCYTAKGPIQVWRAAIHAALGSQKDRPRFSLACHVRIEFNFVTKNKHLYGLPMTSRPDLDNLAKAVLDELVLRSVLSDDSIVAKLTLSKTHTVATDGARISIDEIDRG